MNDNSNNAPTRKGKIARLPYEIREQINEMLRDGVPASRLNTFLMQNGFEAVNDQNWTNWRQGGYQDWLKEQAYIDTVREKHESIRREIEAGGFSVIDKTIYEVATDIANSDLDPGAAAKAIASLKKAVTGADAVKIAERRANVAEEALKLAKNKFERETCALFLKWHDNQKAREIADGKASSEVKMDQLHDLIFGRPPDASPDH